MDHESSAMVLRDGLILLGFALAFVMIFRRFGLGATLGYLVAGAIVGPQVLNLVGNEEEMIGIGEIGIVMLLFVVGLELEPKRLLRMKNAIFGLGGAQVVLCGFAMVAVLYLALNYPWPAAIAVGLSLGLSSTAQVLPQLQSSGGLRTPSGERAFAILLFQDLSIIPLITIIAAMNLNPADADALPWWQLIGITLAAIVGLILAGRFLLRPLFRLIGRLGEREMFIVAGLFTIIASAALMESLGLSTALGAFIAGVMMADTPYRHELEADIEPFRSILLGMFFLAVGMTLDLGAIVQNPAFVVGMALVLIAVKSAIITGLGIVLGMAWRSALALGLLLSQGGEFGFVLFAEAQSGRLISAETSSLFGAIVTLSMATTPFLMMATKRLREGGRDRRDREEPSGEGARALIIGYGRFGQTVAQILIGAGIPVTLIDRKVDQIDVAEEFGAKVYYGDGLRMDLLRQAGAQDASLIAFCTDDKDVIDAEFLHGVREAFPDAKIYIRAFDRRSVMKLDSGPDVFIVREMMESAIAMARAALDGLDESQQAIDKAEDAYRTRDRERLEKQTQAGDLHAGMETVFTQGNEGKAKPAGA